MDPTQRASPVFGISEVLLLIFDHLDQCSLASCARICRLWSEIAQELLWSHLPSLLPVFRLVGDLERVDGTLGKCNTWSVDTDLNSVDWDRVRFLARCMSSIRHSEGSWGKYDVGSILFDDMASLVSALSSGTQYPFPRLRNLVWEASYHPTCVMQILLIIGPSLKVLELEGTRNDVHEPNGAFDKLFTALRHRQDIQLLKLSLHGEPSSPSIDRSFYPFLHRQHSLRSIDMDVLNLQAFVEGVHPALETTLVEVELCAWEDEGEDAYKHLLKLRALESIDLDLLSSRQVRQSDIDSMANAWRNLKSWRSTSLYGGPQELVAMATQLPKLENLAFVLIFDDPMLPRGQSIPLLASLRRLDLSFGFRNMGTVDATVWTAAIAELLTAMCPDVSRIEWDTRAYLGSKERLIWNRLEAEVKRIRNLRMAALGAGRMSASPRYKDMKSITPNITSSLQTESGCPMLRSVSSFIWSEL